MRDSQAASNPGVLVLSPNWLGDAVMALPAIADVKRHIGSRRLVVAARPAVASMFRLAPCVDGVITLEWRGQMLRRAGWTRDVDALRGAACDTALLLPNSFAAAWIARRAGLPERWGYATDLRGALLTRAVRRPGGSVHQAEYYQHLVRALDIPTGPREAVLAVSERARDAARALLIDRGWDGTRPLIVMAPGAAYGKAKQWLPRYFARLAVMLTNVRGAQCALIGTGPDADATALVRALGAEAEPAIIDLAGATTLEQLAGVLGQARVCVSNDSGAMHLAAAIGAPVVAIFGPTREYETSPLARRHQRADVLINPVFCRPCMLRECPIDHRCMKGLAPERVFGAVSDIMMGA
jgi:heptosyltransferase-2